MCAEYVDGYIKGRVYIIASPFKTGTTSVGRALVKLGAGDKIMPYDRNLLKAFKPKIKELNKLAEAVSGIWDFDRLHATQTRETLADLTRECAQYDIFADAPLGHTHIHPFIRRVIAPDAKFIWVNREFIAWRQSVERWQVSHPETYVKHKKWKTHPKMQRDALRKRWRTHRKTFRRLSRWASDDCIELELENLTNYDELAQFCGLPTLDQKFPTVIPPGGLKKEDDRKGPVTTFLKKIGRS